MAACGGWGDEEAPAPPVTVFLQQMAAVVGGTWWQAWRANALGSLTADSHGEKPPGQGGEGGGQQGRSFGSWHHSSSPTGSAPPT